MDKQVPKVRSGTRKNKNGAARIAANNRYNDKAYHRINIAIPKCRKAAVDAAVVEAAAKGLISNPSLNGLSNMLLRQYLGFSEDEWKPSHEEEAAENTPVTIDIVQCAGEDGDRQEKEETPMAQPKLSKITAQSSGIIGEATMDENEIRKYLDVMNSIKPIPHLPVFDMLTFGMANEYFDMPYQSTTLRDHVHALIRTTGNETRYTRAIDAQDCIKAGYKSSSNRTSSNEYQLDGYRIYLRYGALTTTLISDDVLAYAAAHLTRNPLAKQIRDKVQACEASSGVQTPIMTAKTNRQEQPARQDAASRKYKREKSKASMTFLTAGDELDDNTNKGDDDMARKAHTSAAVKNRYANDHYDRVRVDAPKGRRQTLEEATDAAKSKGLLGDEYGVSGFVNMVLREYLGFTKDEWEFKDKEDSNMSSDTLQDNGTTREALSEGIYDGSQHGTIRYKVDILEALREAGYSSYGFRNKKYDDIGGNINQVALQRLREGKLIAWEQLAAVCKLLKCQPGDLLEYAPDDAPADAESSTTTDDDAIVDNMADHEGDQDMIKYDKLNKMLDDKGITSYTVKKSGVIGQASFAKLRSGGDINTSTIDKLCAMLNCQPGDMLEYVPDDDASPNATQQKQTHKSIKYKIDVLEALKDKGYTTYKIRKENLLSESTVQKFRNHDASLTLDNLSAVCALLDCQPSDIIEYSEDMPDVEHAATPAIQVNDVMEQILAVMDAQSAEIERLKQETARLRNESDTSRASLIRMRRYIQDLDTNSAASPIAEKTDDKQIKMPISSLDSNHAANSTTTTPSEQSGHRYNKVTGRPVLKALISAFGEDRRVTAWYNPWPMYYKKLKDETGIDVKARLEETGRKGDNMLDMIRDDEFDVAIKCAIDMCRQNGVNIDGIVD